MKGGRGRRYRPHRRSDVLQINKCLHVSTSVSCSVFYVLDLYFRIKDDPTLDTPNRVSFSAREGRPPYIRASIIKPINAIAAELANNDADINGRIRLRPSSTEFITFACRAISSPMSEQISMAGSARPRARRRSS